MTSGQVEDGTPFWNVNVPASEHTTECPDFLKYALENEKDRDILRTPDNQYQRLSWPNVQETIRKNQIDVFQRTPSDLRTYREWSANVSKEHGSIMNFVVNERLQWPDLTPVGSNFENAGTKGGRMPLTCR